MGLRVSRLLFGGTASLALGLFTATCQLGDLVKPTAPGTLAVSPLVLTDSAPMGSPLGRNQTLSITSDGSAGLSWKATVANGSAWVQLARSQDTVPTTLTVTLRASGLGVGMYKDTIQLISGDREDDVVRVPVSFAIIRTSVAPNTPSSLGQFKIDGTTIPPGGLTTERTVVFRGRVSDPDAGDSLRLEAEVQPIGIPFSNVPNAVSNQVANGASASAAATGLTDYTSYHWQVRASDRAGNHSAWFSYGGNSESEADFRVVLPPTRLVFLTEPTNTTAGAAITPAVRVAVEDAGGSTVSYFTGDITVAIGTNPGTGRLTGAVTVAAVGGIATFPDLAIDRAGAGYMLAASSTGLSSATSAPFDILASAPTTLVFTTQPGSTAADAAMTPAVRVSARDASGNSVATFAGPVTISIATNPAGGTLRGTLTVLAAEGVATFGDLTIDRLGTGYTLQAVSDGLTSAISDPFNVTAATVSATLSTVTASPASIAAGTGASTVTVTARDGAGNVVPGAAVTVAATGTGNTWTPASGPTDATGVFTATFSSTIAESKTISATINGVAISQTATVTVTGGGSGGVSASQSTVSASPGTVVASSGSNTATVTVTARDETGAPVAGASVTFSSTGTGNVFTRAPGTTDAGGVLTATFSSTKAETKTISATINSTAITQTVTVTVTSAAATTLSFTVQPSTTAAAAVIAPPVQVTARDSFGNAAGIGQVTIAIGTNPAGGTLSGTATVTSSGGVASFGNLSINNPGTGYTLRATATGLPDATSAAFNITP